jgi:hypothetical protein
MTKGRWYRGNALHRDYGAADHWYKKHGHYWHEHHGRIHREDGPANQYAGTQDFIYGRNSSKLGYLSNLYRLLRVRLM